MSKRTAYAAVVRRNGFGLGIATEDEAGYVPFGNDTYETFDEAMDAAKALNRAAGLSEMGEFSVIASSIKAQNEERKRRRQEADG